MDRDEILKRAKESNDTDEMKTKVQRDSFKIAYVAGAILAILLMIQKMLTNQPWEEVYAIIVVMMAAQNFYIWFKLHDKKSTLAAAILSSIATVLLIVTYCIKTF